MEREAKSRAEERKEIAETNKQDQLTNWDLPPALAAQMEVMEKKEKEVEAKIDNVALTFAKKAGYNEVPWFKLTWWLLGLYTVLTIFVMFMRPDFLNMTICIVALYMMFNTDLITKNKFRVLVLGIVLSLVYDLFWFIMKHSEYSEEKKNDGSGESGVRKFSLFMSYASFILRVTHQFPIHKTYRFSWQ